MRLVDTHCHLYADDFNEDLVDTIERSIEAGVDKVLLRLKEIVTKNIKFLNFQY